MRLPYLLVLVALPALAGSLFLMQHAHAGRGLLIQQVTVSGIAIVVCLLACRAKLPAARMPWFIGGAFLAVLVPLLLPTEGPRRWINLGGFQFYSAALVLPATLLLLSETMQRAKDKIPWPLITVIGIALVLALQPDASQVTAFALACALLFHRAPIALALVGCITLAWKLPDPLKPVPYVEGVLEFAAGISPVALIAALIAIVLPPTILLWQARAYKSMALASVALYYVAIDVLAYFQRTPMPLLGYGASPLLGYFAMVALIPSCAARQKETD
ncbi:MAG: hypothetical protein QM758_12755 [Armatimonas sp.]